MAKPYRGKQYLANLACMITMPAVLVPGAKARSRITTAHKRATTEAMKFAAAKHHKKRIPVHFKRGTQKKYKPAKRAKKTMFLKKQAIGVADWDLVKSSTMRRQVTQRKEIRRVGTSTGVTVLLRMLFPGNMVPNRRGSKGVTMDVMAQEVARMTPEEENQFVADVAEEHQEQLDKVLKPRQRRRIMMGPYFGRAAIT